MKYPTQSPVYLETELDILGKETSKSTPDNPEMKWKSLEYIVTFAPLRHCCYLSVCRAISCITQSIERP